MNAAFVHLAVNHLALFAVLFAIPLLVWGIRRQSLELVAAGLALGVTVGIGGGLASLSGERAEEIVEEIPAVSDDAIEEHEDSGKFALWGGIGLGLVSLYGLFMAGRTGNIPRPASLIALGLAILMLAVVARTAWLGGMIRHPEAHGLPVEGVQSDP